MKPRKVIVTLELETNAPIGRLREAKNWAISVYNADGKEFQPDVHQVQVNVVKGMSKREMIDAMKPKEPT